MPEISRYTWAKQAFALAREILQIKSAKLL